MVPKKQAVCCAYCLGGIALGLGGLSGRVAYVRITVFSQAIGVGGLKHAGCFGCSSFAGLAHLRAGCSLAWGGSMPGDTLARGPAGRGRGPAGPNYWVVRGPRRGGNFGEPLASFQRSDHNHSRL